MYIEEHYSLKSYNSFGFDVSTRYFAAPATVDELKELLHDERFKQLPKFVLGGGSNIVFTQNFEGLTIYPSMGEIEIMEVNADHVLVRAGAGLNWDEFAGYCVNQGWSGLENLSYIPGNVGASPVQNIGAYGVEAKDCIERVEGILVDSCAFFSLENIDCRFGYRDSIFKHDWKGEAVITHVTFKLNTSFTPILNYGNIAEKLQQNTQPTVQQVRDAIIEIRKQKLPDPNELPNGGSFFKNPVIPIALFNKLKNDYPTIPSYPVNETHIKVPAAWLIDQCGWKGKRVGNVGVHTNQALVLVHYGNAQARDLLALATNIQNDVEKTFGITLEREVNTL